MGIAEKLYNVTTRRQLRAATQGDLDFPRTRTVTYGSRALAVSGPTVLELTTVISKVTVAETRSFL